MGLPNLCNVSSQEKNQIKTYCDETQKMAFNSQTARAKDTTLIEPRWAKLKTGKRPIDEHFRLGCH